MEKKKGNAATAVWEALYPVLLYYGILLVAVQALNWIGTKWNTKLGEVLAGDYSLIQMIGAIIVIPIIFNLYANDRNGHTGMWNYMKDHKPRIGGKQILNAAVCGIAMIFLGFGMNNILYMSGLTENSAAFQSANTALYSGSLVTELLCSGFFIPILEELVYRGVVQQRMKKYMKPVFAVLISTALFALMHANSVQVIYAALLGFLLAVFVEKTGHIYVSIIGHMAVNTFAIFRTEFGFLNDMELASPAHWVIALAAVALGILISLVYNREFFKKKEEA